MDVQILKPGPFRAHAASNSSCLPELTACVSIGVLPPSGSTVLLLLLLLLLEHSMLSCRGVRAESF